MPACLPDTPEDGVDPPAEVPGAFVQLECPRVAAAPGAGGAALAYSRRYCGSSDCAPDAALPADSVRVVFFDSEGCPAADETGSTSRAVGDEGSDRRLSHVQIVALADGEFLVTWLSLSHDLRAFDDRIRARLVSKTPPHFLPNFGSLAGDAVDLEVPDRWMLSPTTVSLGRDASGQPRFALVWYACRASGIGAAYVAVFGGSLAPLSDILHFDDDTDAEEALVYKSFATAYDDSTSRLILAWTRSADDGALTVNGAVVVVSPTNTLALESYRSPNDGPGGNSYSPTVTSLGSDALFFGWASDRGGGLLSGRVLHASGRAWYTTFDPGPHAFELTAPSAGSQFSPQSLDADSRLLLFWTEERAGTTATTWRLYDSTISRDELLRP